MTRRRLLIDGGNFFHEGPWVDEPDDQEEHADQGSADDGAEPPPVPTDTLG